MKPRILRVFLPFAFGFFVSYIYRAVNSIIAPDLVADVGVDPSQLGLLTSTYFLAFVTTQLPLGVILDRYGPRRIEATMLLVAALGAVVFSRAQGLGALILGRALIGFGVSACLMGALKAYVLWVPKERLPLINGLQLAAGGFGALVATAPVQFALGFTDWRGVFLGLAALTLVTAGLVYFVVPEHEREGTPQSLGTQMAAMRKIYGSLHFWRIAPWVALNQASFLALQGLWAGPWLLDVAGYSRETTSIILMLIAVSMVAGYVSIGSIAHRLHRRGIPLAAVCAGGMLAFLGTLLMLILPPWGATPILWMLFGFFGTSGALGYAILAQRVPPEAAGKVNTAQNLLIFVGAFVAQWGVGAVIAGSPAADGMGYAPAGYRSAMLIIAAFLTLGALWFWVAGFLETKERPAPDTAEG